MIAETALQTIAIVLFAGAIVWLATALAPAPASRRLRSGRLPQTAGFAAGSKPVVAAGFACPLAGLLPIVRTLLAGSAKRVVGEAVPAF